MGQLVYLHDGYDLGGDPGEFLGTFTEDVMCSQLFVEFLMTTEGDEPAQELKKASNHAVFTLLFAEDYQDFSGIRLEMTLDDQYDSKSDSTTGGTPVRYRRGHLKVNPTSTREASTQSASTCELSIDKNWTVRRFIEMLFESDMHKFEFVCLQDSYFGCRDFVSQAILVFHSQGFVRSETILTVLSGPALPVSSIYDALGLRFTPDARIFSCPIDKGRFASFERKGLSIVPYKGSRKAGDVERLIGDIRRS